MDLPPDPTAEEFRAVCTLLWGDGWRPTAARALGVDLRNVQHWAAEPPARGKPVPPGVMADLAGLVSEAMADPAQAARMTRVAAILQQLTARGN